MYLNYCTQKRRLIKSFGSVITFMLAQSDPIKQGTLYYFGIDVKVENFKAEKVLDHFRVCVFKARRVLRPKVEGGVFKAEWLEGC